MAAPFVERSTGIVVIEWYESKETSSTPTKHHFEAKPIKLQTHPKNPSKIIRIYFEGRMPGWVKRYVKEKEHPFECAEIFQNGMVGWWIANWRRFDEGKPFNAPTIKGCINSFIYLIPSVVEDYRERMRNAMDTIAVNLSKHPTFYEPFGLYYRPEEITGDGGAMVVDENLFPVRMSDESDLDFESRIRSHGGLDRLIFEMTTPLPVSTSEEGEEGIYEEEFELAFEDEGDFDFDYEKEGEFTLMAEADPLIGYSLEFADEDGEIPQKKEGGAEDPEAREAETNPDIESAAAEEQSEQPVQTEEELSVFDSDNPGNSVTATIKSEGSELVAAAAGDPECNVDGAVDQAKHEGLMQLHMVNNSNRKHSAVAGQLSFF